MRERARERTRESESHGVDDTQLTCQAGRKRTSSGVAAAHISSSSGNGDSNQNVTVGTSTSGCVTHKGLLHFEANVCNISIIVAIAV